MDCDWSHEELAAFTDGDVTPERAAEADAHLRACDTCRRRVATLREVTASLSALAGEEPPSGISLGTRQALLRELRTAPEPEVMTLEEVAEFLRVPPGDLAAVVSELPTFELAGHLRVRRAALEDWIARRERRQRRQVAESQVARALRRALPPATTSPELS